jgi:hypothetical protein
VSHISTATLFNLCFFFHKVYLLPTFCRGCYEDMLITPDRTSYYLLGCGGGVRRFKVGLDLDLVATKHWLMAPIRLLRVPLLLKPSVERGAIPSYCLSRGIYPEACIAYSPNAFVVFYSGNSLRSWRCTRLLLYCPVSVSVM